MVIAIPSDDGINITENTGYADGFLIYEIWDSKAALIEFRRNPSKPRKDSLTPHDQQSSDEEYFNMEWTYKALHDCDILIAIGVNTKHLKRISEFGVETRFCREQNAGAAVELFARGELPLFEEYRYRVETPGIPSFLQTSHPQLERINGKLSRN